MALAPLVDDVLGGDIPLAVKAYDGSRAGPGRRADHAGGALARRAAPHHHRTGRAGHRPGLRGRRPRHRRRHLGAARPARPHAARAAGAPRHAAPGARAGRVARGAAPGAAGGGGSAARAAPQPGPRRRRHQPPLRRVQRLLPPRAGPQPDLLVRGVPRRRRHAGAGAGQQVRADLRASSAWSRACACSTWAAAGAAWCCTPPSTTACGRSASPSRGARPSWPRSGRSRRACPTRSRSACRTTATSTTAPSTPSARSACSSTWARRGWPSTSGACGRCCGPAGRLLNHGISHPPGHRARLPRRSFINRYVFPDGELHEVGRVSRSLAGAGLRGAPSSRPCASTTP